jgi:integrase
MPKKSAVPSYRLHKASGQARVLIRGRHVYLGKFNSPESREKYQRTLAEMGSPAADAPPAADPDGLTVVEMLVAYFDHAGGYYRHSNELDNIKKALRPLREVYGLTRVLEFGPKRLKALRRTMIAADLSRGVINERIRVIVRVFGWAASEELLPSAVPEALREVKGLRKGFTEAREPRPVEPVTDEDVQATLPHLSPIVADMVRLQRLTGARPTEVCTMTPGAVDRTGAVWEYRLTEHKNAWRGKNRTICIGPQARAVLLPYLLRADDAYCFSPAESEEKRRIERLERRRTPMSCGNRRGSNRSRKPRRPAGDHYTRDSYRRAIHRACDLAGIERWSPNRLRHAAATEIRQKCGLEAAQVALGHSNAQITQVYAERDLSLARRVAAEVG